MQKWLKPDTRAVLLEERLIGYLDPGAERFLRSMNEPPKLYTTSSCTGRITVVEGRFHWLRDGARIVYKTHTHITVYELKRVLSRPFKDLWLKATGPIVHLRAATIDCALQVLDASRRAGFKHSGIISRGVEGFTVEVMSSLQLHAPLRIEGEDLYSPEALESLVALANQILEEGWRRLEELSTAVPTLENCY
ncbi:MAG: hypothetical protein F7B17_05490 [Desulfurococcales archaeon]|nr:hypothetical protein [Desulfurococcales archaeon]